MTRLHDLYLQGGQSPWLDNLKRSYLRDGRLQSLLDAGIRGVTSNPTIFAKAIEGEDDYDEEFCDLVATKTVEEAYWDMAVGDVAEAAGLLRPLHAQSQGCDGFVSIEVAPELAHDEDATVEAATELHARLRLPNVLVKIPATPEGVRAIRRMVATGHSINVTLIFGLDRYLEVIDAYLAGLEELAASGRDLSGVASVASFFVSRVDTEVDRRLESLAGAGRPAGAPDPLALRGRAAVANAKLAYQAFRERFRGPRWEALAARGARLQRPLWASTSTKNPAYPDLVYVDNLIGPDTVNTMPDATVEAFLDHGRVARTVDEGLDEAHRTMDELASLGVDMADVARTLEDEGVAAFSKSFEELLQVLSDKAHALGASPKGA
jgi:transaldolase